MVVPPQVVSVRREYGSIRDVRAYPSTLAPMNIVHEAGNRAALQLGFERALGVRHDAFERSLDMASDQTVRVRSLRMHREQRPFVHGAIDVAQRDVLPRTGQPRAAASTELRGGEAGLCQLREQ